MAAVAAHSKERKEEMKVLTRALIALVLSLGLAAAYNAPAQADSAAPIWQWGTWRGCHEGSTTVEKCAYGVVFDLVGYTGETGCIVVVQAPEFCKELVDHEKNWLWHPVTTWDLAQAEIRGYEQVTTNPDVVRSDFSKTFAQSLLTTAKTRVDSLFDPVTHEYLGTPPPVSKAFSKVYTPTVSGTAKVGKTLKVTVRNSSPGATFGKQWLRAGVAIAGATGWSYKMVAADLGSAISVTVTGSRAGYAATMKTSSPTKLVALGSLSRGKVKVTGTKRVGRTLTAKTWKWSSGATYSFQWFRNGIAVVNATAKTYVQLPMDLSARFKVKVATIKEGYTPSSSRISARTSKVKKGYITKVTPVISGNAITGETLTVNPGTWKPLDVALTYQWYRSGKKITGQTGTTLLLSALDLGKTFKVKVMATAVGYYSTSRYSHSTAKVTSPVPPPPPPTPTPTPTPPPGTP